MLPSSTVRFVSESAVFLTRRNLPFPSSCLLRAFISIHHGHDRPLTYSFIRRGLSPASVFIQISADGDKTRSTFSRRFHLSSTLSASHYDTLGVPTTATQTEVKHAFYRLSKELHPDRNPDSPNSVEKFKTVSAAYEVVGNPEKRRKYDAELRPGLRQRESTDFSDPESGPGFSSGKGDQWRQGYDRSAG